MPTALARPSTTTKQMTAHTPKTMTSNAREPKYERWRSTSIPPAVAAPSPEERRRLSLSLRISCICRFTSLLIPLVIFAPLFERVKPNGLCGSSASLSESCAIPDPKRMCAGRLKCPAMQRNHTRAICSIPWHLAPGTRIHDSTTTTHSHSTLYRFMYYPVLRTCTCTNSRSLPY